MMNSLVLNSMRHKVSADKNRYREDNYDLDLTYITDRIIGMAFPAEGVEATYRNNIDHVATLLKEKHRRNYVLYNLSNRPYDCKKFDERVVNWCGFPDHHPPPLALLFKIVHSIHQWLESFPTNVAVIHCLAGKGRTGVIIACYFLYCGLFEDINYAMNYFSYRRSLNTWGVTGPSQLRYMQYFSDILHNKAIPHLSTMHLLQLRFYPIPRFAIGGGEKGCTPFFEIYQLQREKVLLFSSENTEGDIPPININQQVAIFPVNCMIQGDILIHFKHITPMHSTEPLFDFVFNVGMVHGARVIFPKGELEKAEKDLRFPNDFKVELRMEPCTDAVYHLSQQQKELQLNLFMKRTKEAPDICFTGYKMRKDSRIKIARDIGNWTQGSYCVKGGWLYKQGHRVKNWKRRWFVLRSSSISYYKNPRYLKALGEIHLDSISSVSIIEDNEMYFCFKIITNNVPFLCSAATKYIRDGWVKAIKYAVSLKQDQSSYIVPLGSIDIHLKESKYFKYNGELCCTLTLGDRLLISRVKPSNKQDSIIFDEKYSLTVLDPECSLEIILWQNDYEVCKNTALAQLSIPLPLIKSTSPSDDWYHLQPISESKFSIDYQVHLSFIYNAVPLLDELIVAENEILFESEKRCVRLFHNPSNVTETQHSSYTRYFNTTRPLSKTSFKRRSLTFSGESAQNPLLKRTESIPTQFKRGIYPSTRNKGSLIGVRTQIVSEMQDESNTSTTSLTQDDSNSSLSNDNDNNILNTSIDGDDNTNICNNIIIEESSEDSNENEKETVISAGMVRLFDSNLLEITCMIYSTNILWIGDKSGCIHRLDPLTGEKFQSIKAHKQSIQDIQILNDKICTCSHNSISIWNSTGILSRSFILDSPILQILCTPYKDIYNIWVSSLNNTKGEISVYSSTTFKCKKKVNMSNSIVGCLYYENNVVWIGALDFILAFDINSLKCISKIKVGLGMVSQILSYNNTLWITCQETSDIIIFDKNKKYFMTTLAVDDTAGPLLCINEFIWNAAGNKLYVWDTITFECIMKIDTQHSDNIISLLLLENNIFCSLSQTNDIGIWKYSMK